MRFEKTERQSEAVRLLGGRARHVLLYGGSRSGKTFIMVYALLVRAFKERCRQVVLRKHFNHVKQAIWLDTLPKVIELCFSGILDKLRWDKTDWFVSFPNGSELWFGGLDDKERTEKILGKEYSTIFFNECSEIDYNSRNIALTRLSERNGLVKKAYYDCNPPKVTHWTYKLWVDGVDDKGKKVDIADYGLMRMNPHDNLDNIDKDYITEVLDKLPPLLRDRFLLGQFGSDGSDIFKSEWMVPSDRTLSDADIAAVFSFCDPAITSKEMERESSCESGIVTLAVDYDGGIHDIEVLHGLWEYQELKEKCRGVWKRWGRHASFFFGVEDVAFQKALCSDLDAMGIGVVRLKPDSDKVRRAISVTDLMAEGRVRINNADLRGQLISFPSGKLKDLVDAYVYCLRMVKQFSEKRYEKKTDKYAHLSGRDKDFWMAQNGEHPVYNQKKDEVSFYKQMF